MRTLGIDIGVNSMGLTVIEYDETKLPMQNAEVSYANTLTISPFVFPESSKCCGMTPKGKPCTRKLSHGRVLRGAFIASCKDHARKNSCRIMSAARLRSGAIIEQLREPFEEIHERFPDIRIIVIESQPKMSNMYSIQFPVEAVAHLAFPNAITVFQSSKNKLSQIGIKAPRGKRKHTARKNLAENALKAGIEAGEIKCSGIEVSLPAEIFDSLEVKKYDDIADSLIVAVAATKRVLRNFVLIDSEYDDIYGMSGIF